MSLEFLQIFFVSAAITDECAGTLWARCYLGGSPGCFAVSDCFACCSIMSFLKGMLVDRKKVLMAGLVDIDVCIGTRNHEFSRANLGVTSWLPYLLCVALYVFCIAGSIVLVCRHDLSPDTKYFSYNSQPLTDHRPL